MPQSYTALIIDLKKSRDYSIEDRNRIQRFIVNITQLLNDLFHHTLIRDVDFSAGDEIQGLFSTPVAAYLYYRMLSMWLHPVEIRAGIGVGRWDVQLDNKGTTGQDGSAYHNARRAIQNADDGEGYPVLFFSGSPSDITINTIIGGAASIMSKQSVYQNQIMLLTELLYPIGSRGVPDSGGYPQTDLEDCLYAKSLLAREMDQITRALPLDRMEEMINPLLDHLFYRTEITYFENAEGFRKENSFFITSGKQRGLPTTLSKLLGISRQTIEKTIKAADIFTARNMAIAAILEINIIGSER